MSSRILVVEDNADNMTLVSWILEDAGYQFWGAPRAEEAFETLAQHEIDLVLMDISLPGIDGMEATRRLRRDPRYRQLPIIAVTAHVVGALDSEILEAGANEVVHKPIEEQQLLATIERILHNTE